MFNGQSIVKSFFLVNYSGYSGGIFNDGQLAKEIWGATSNNVYAVGTKGAIAFYNGFIWQRLEPTTDLNINDIWGEKSKDGAYEIICVAANRSINQGQKVLKIKNNTISALSDEGLPWSINSIWFKPGSEYFITGDGFYYTNDLNGKWQRGSGLFPYYQTYIRGNAPNDFFICGSYGLLVHYNESSWKNFQHITTINGSFATVDIKENTACVVGMNGNRAVIFLGKR